MDLTMTDSAIGSGFYKNRIIFRNKNTNDRIPRYNWISSFVSVVDEGPYYLSFNKIVDGDQCFELRETLNLTVIYEDGYYTLRYRDLDIVLAEKTLSDLFNSFQEEFLMLWDEYALEDDENLTEQAQQLKQNLKSLVLIS